MFSLVKMVFEVSSLLILFLACANAANILILSSLPSYSHHKWSSVLGEELGARNHNVTIFSQFFVESPPRGVQYLFIESKSDANGEYARQAPKRSRKPCAFYEFLHYAFLSRQMCYEVIESAAFHQLLNYPNDLFDLIIHDFTGGPCMMPFVHKFENAQLIIATPYSNSPFLANIIGGHHHYAYIPHTIFSFDTNMTFWQRLINFSFHMIERFGREYFLLKELDFIMPKYFGPDLPPISDLEKRAKLALVNANPIIDTLEPLLPTVIPIGGIHIKKAKALPKDLEIFLNSSKKGTILFSFGSMIRGDNLSLEKQKLFIRIFDEFADYNFLWKFESNITVDEPPKNVWIRPWLPQTDLLAHPKVKALITHGGLLSIHEAIWRGVPMIVTPFLLDQYANTNKVKRLEIAESLDFYSLSYNETRDTLSKVLNDPKYLINVKRLAGIIQDQKETPLERAVWWIEWLLRNPNIDHMQSPVQNLGYIVGNSFDVIVVYVLLHAFLLFALIYWRCKKNVRHLSNLVKNYGQSIKKHEKQS